MTVVALAFLSIMVAVLVGGVAARLRMVGAALPIRPASAVTSLSLIASEVASAST